MVNLPERSTMTTPSTFRVFTFKLIQPPVSLVGRPREINLYRYLVSSGYCLRLRLLVQCPDAIVHFAAVRGREHFHPVDRCRCAGHTERGPGTVASRPDRARTRSAGIHVVARR